MVIQKQNEVKDPLMEMADKLRVKGGVEWRQAILADQRVEFFRGKDFAAHYREHSDALRPYAPKGLPMRKPIIQKCLLGLVVETHKNGELTCASIAA